LNHPHIDNALADALRPSGLVAALGDQRVGQILVAKALQIPVTHEWMWTLNASAAQNDAAYRCRAPSIPPNSVVIFFVILF